MGETGAKVFAHPEEGISGAYEHSPNGDGTDDVAPDGGCLIGPTCVGGAGRQEAMELWSEKEHEERDHESPGEHAAGELDGSQAQPDDVTDAEIGGADAGSGGGAERAGGENMRAPRGPEADLTLFERADIEEKLFVGGEQLEAAQEVEDAADPDIPEKKFGCFGATLAGFVNFGRGDRFRKRKFWIFDHHAADEGDEENPENAADHDEGGGFPISVSGREGWPSFSNDECGERKNGAGGHGFADRACGSGDVFFE